MPNARIPALEDAGLSVVPGYRVDPETGQEDPTWRTEFFAWYERVRDWRLWAQQQFVKDPDFRKSLLLLASRDPAFFTLVFLEVKEPRAVAYFDHTGYTFEQALAHLHDEDDTDIGVADLSYRTIHPFIPFAYQVQAQRLCTRVILGPMRNFPHDLLWHKARGIGMSYAVLAWAYWGWLHVEGLHGTILTEKWDKAERTKDVNSLFGKLDLFLDSTPDLLIPEGFKWRGEKDADRLAGRLINPQNGAAIFTETTTKDSTRGGRDAYVAVDELNFHEDLEDTWATIHGTTYHCLGWTTASRRYGRQGEEILKQGRLHPTAATVVTLDWNENPHQDQQWFDRERERFRAAGMLEQFDVEYLRNPTAASGRLVYIDQLQTLGDAAWTSEGYTPDKPLKVSVDPGISDFTAFVFWQTHFVQEKKRIRWIEACQLRNVPVQFWAHVMTGILPRPAEDGHEPDEMYRYFLEGFFELPHIERLMTFMRDIPPSAIKLYGDPAMRSRDATHGSWIDTFWKLTLALRQREYGAGDPRAIPMNVTLPWELLVKRNNDQDHRVGMRQALMVSEFSRGSDGVAELYEAIQNTMFQKTTQTSTRAPGHLHTDEYHMVSAAQYGMTWEMVGMTPQELASLSRQPEKPKTTRGHGRPVRTRSVGSPAQRQSRGHGEGRRPVRPADALVGLF